MGKMWQLTLSHSSNFLWILVVLGIGIVSLGVAAGDNESKPTVVQTKNGKIRGLEETRSLSGKKYLAFRGLRYANPPIKELRFKV